MKMKLKIKMKMKMKKGRGVFFSTTGTAVPKYWRSSSFSFEQLPVEAKKKKQTTKEEEEQRNEEQKTKLFCGPESMRALTKKLLKTHLSRTGDGKEKKN